MTAALASRIAPPARSLPLMPTWSGGNGPSATSSVESFAPPVAEPLPLRSPADAEALAYDADLPANALGALTRVVLTQWVAALVLYEVVVATLDRKGRVLPTLGI